MKRFLYSLSLLFVFSTSQISFANKKLFEAALAGEWDKFWGIRLKDPTADLDYSEDGISVRSLVEDVGYFDLLEPVERSPVFQRPRLWPLTVEPSIAVRTLPHRTLGPAEPMRAEPMDIADEDVWLLNGAELTSGAADIGF